MITYVIIQEKKKKPDNFNINIIYVKIKLKNKLMKINIIKKKNHS